MKTGIIGTCILAALVALTLSWSIAGEDQPPADAQIVWTLITETHDYTQWSMWPGHEGMYAGKSPHGAFLKLYGNDIAIQAAKAGKAMPYGALLVKENYGKDKETLMAITPMYKVQGYNAEAGDWWWAKYGPEGQAMASGKVEGCINCHKAVKDNDYIFTKAK